VAAQSSTFEPTHFLQGGYANLPVGVGRVNNVQVGVRAVNDIASSLTLQAFTDVGSVRITVNPVPDVIASFGSGAITDYTTAAQVNALGWRLESDFLAHPGVQIRVTELWLDVDWDPAISGFKGMLLALGPLVAIGLAEMPAIARELARRTRTRILPHEYAAAWRELREDRARRYFPLGA
jgi:hypothetical protein